MKKEWYWQFSSGKIYKVVSDPEKGTITVYSPKGDIVQENENMSPKQVRLIEENFLAITAVETKPERIETEEEKVGQYIR